MTRTIFIYGILISLAAFGLSWLDYRFWMRDIGFEVYGIVIAVVFAGLGMWIERQRRPKSLPEPSSPNAEAIKALGLTAREVEMIEFLRRGKSNKEIARDLDLSPNTIKTHLTNLYVKLGARNRTQAVTKAAELSLHSAVNSGEKAELTHLGE